MAELLPQAMPGRSCPLGIRLRFEMGRDIIAAKEKEAKSGVPQRKSQVRRKS